MGGRWRWALAVMVVAWTAPPAAVAQAGSGQRCDQTRQAGFRRIRNARGEETVFISGPARFVCTGGMVVESDSAVWQSTIGALELIGNVVYQDSAQTLTSDWANYLEGGTQLYARGSVVLTDHSNGSTARGQELEYRQATEDQPQSRAVLQGGRPHAVLRPAADSAGTSAAEDSVPPIEVDAAWMEFLGDSLFRARDDVVIVRGATNAYSHYAEFDQTGERLFLRDSARVEDPDYQLRGDDIRAWFGGKELREVHATGHGELDSDDLRLRAPRLFIGFREGALETLSAWAPPPADTAAPDSTGAAMEPGRAVALAEDFELEADSIHAWAPGQRLERVTAVGQAFGQRKADSLSATLPAGLARDWIRGDTIIGFFVEPMDSLAMAADTTVGIGFPTMPATDSARLAVDSARLAVERGAAAPDTGEITLKRVLVIGGREPARSLYRIAPEEGEAGRKPGVNFMAAKRITLVFEDGEISGVEADGPIEGIYLDPDTATEPADSTAPPPAVAEPKGKVK